MPTITTLAVIPWTNAHKHLQSDLLRERHELTYVATAREVKLAALFLVVNPEDIPAQPDRPLVKWLLEMSSPR